MVRGKETVEAELEQLFDIQNDLTGAQRAFVAGAQVALCWVLTRQNLNPMRALKFATDEWLRSAEKLQTPKAP